MCIISPINRRRPVSAKVSKTYRAVERAIIDRDVFTERDVARSTKQAKASVRQALMRLERLGVLTVKGYQRTKRGRPMRVWQRT